NCPAADGGAGSVQRGARTTRSLQPHGIIAIATVELQISARGRERVIQSKRVVTSERVDDHLPTENGWQYIDGAGIDACPQRRSDSIPPGILNADFSANIADAHVIILAADFGVSQNKIVSRQSYPGSG